MEVLQISAKPAIVYEFMEMHISLELAGVTFFNWNAQQIILFNIKTELVHVSSSIKGN